MHTTHCHHKTKMAQQSIHQNLLLFVAQILYGDKTGADLCRSPRPPGPFPLSLLSPCPTQTDCMDTRALLSSNSLKNHSSVWRSQPTLHLILWYQLWDVRMLTHAQHRHAFPPDSARFISRTEGCVELRKHEIHTPENRGQAGVRDRTIYLTGVLTVGTAVTLSRESLHTR